MILSIAPASGDIRQHSCGLRLEIRGNNMRGAGGEGEAGRPRLGVRQLEGKTKPAVSAQRWAACAALKYSVQNL